MKMVLEPEVMQPQEPNNSTSQVCLAGIPVHHIEHSQISSEEYEKTIASAMQKLEEKLTGPLADRGFTEMFIAIELVPAIRIYIR